MFHETDLLTALRIKYPNHIFNIQTKIDPDTFTSSYRIYVNNLELFPKWDIELYTDKPLSGMNIQNLYDEFLKELFKAIDNLK